MNKSQNEHTRSQWKNSTPSFGSGNKSNRSFLPFIGWGGGVRGRAKSVKLCFTMAWWVTSVPHVLIQCPRSVESERQAGKSTKCRSWYARSEMICEGKNTNPDPTYIVVITGFFFAFPSRPCTPQELVLFFFFFLFYLLLFLSWLTQWLACSRCPIKKKSGLSKQTNGGEKDVCGGEGFLLISFLSSLPSFLLISWPNYFHVSIPE